MNNRIYFNNINKVGNLYLDKVLIYFEEPILFTCKDIRGELYLCLCSEVRLVQRWVVTKISRKILRNLLQDKISIFDSFEEDVSTKYIFEFSSGEKNIEVFEKQFEELDLLDLPEKDVFLEDEDSFCDYIKELEEITVFIDREITLKNNINNGKVLQNNSNGVCKNYHDVTIKKQSDMSINLIDKVDDIMELVA